MIGEGHGAVRLVDVSGNTIQLDTSGRITIAGGSITASVSGDTVIAKVSGETIVSSISGNTVVASVSGERIRTTGASGMNAVYLTNQSGNIAVLTHATTDSISTTNILPINMMGFDPTSTFLNRIRTTISGLAASQNGTVFRLLTCISGDPVKMSGEAVTISGNNVKEFGSTVKTGGWIQIHGASGGQQLSGATCFAATIRSHSGNALMLVGGIGAQAPVSGTIGLHLFGGESYEARVSNLNTISIVAHTSGQFISYALVDA